MEQELFMTRLYWVEYSTQSVWNIWRTWKTFYPDENNVVLNENSVERKPCLNRESKSDELTIKLYSCHDINMKFLAVVTPPSIYHSCSTRKTFWEEKFTGKKDLFQSMNMKNCGRHKVRKYEEIKGSDKIVTLNISAKFDSLYKMKVAGSWLMFGGPFFIR